MAREHYPTIAALYLVASDEEADVLERLRIKAGFLWRCKCRWTNEVRRKTCEDCGAKRQQGA